jgi:hypothetical protein
MAKTSGGRGRKPRAAEGAPSGDPKLYLIQLPAERGAAGRFKYKVVVEVGDLPDPAVGNSVEALGFLQLLNAMFADQNYPKFLSANFPLGTNPLQFLSSWRLKAMTTVPDED